MGGEGLDEAHHGPRHLGAALGAAEERRAQELRVAAGGSGGGSALGGARHVHSVGLEAPHPACRGAARALDADEGRAGLCAATGQGRPQRAKIKKKKNKCARVHVCV